MSILIKDVTAITLDEKDDILSNADIVVEGKHILSTGTVPEGFTPDLVIDGHNYIALPAFFNSHCHSAMTLERGWAEDLPFDRWLNEKIWVAESAMEPEDVYWGSVLACCEMIRSGTVGFCDHYFYMDMVAKAVAESGMKATLAWCQFGTGKDGEVGKKTFEDTLSFIREYHNSCEGRIKCVVGPHSPYMCPPDFLVLVADKARELNTGIHLHLSESEEQVSVSMAKYGRSPVEHLLNTGVFDSHCISAHCISVSDEDIKILSEKGVYVAHTPKTYMKLAMGMSPLEKLLKGGVKVGLGTDGPASNNDLNMLEVMRLTGLVHKNLTGDPASFPGDVILRLATGGSASLMGFKDSGVIKEGSPADIILFNKKKTHWTPCHDVKSNIVYTSHPDDIEYVICDGKLLLDKGNLTTLDEEKIMYEAEKRAFRMVGREMNPVRSYKG